MAHDIIERCAVENDYIEYKKSSEFKDGILITECFSFLISSNHMEPATAVQKTLDVNGSPNTGYVVTKEDLIVEAEIEETEELAEELEAEIISEVEEDTETIAESAEAIETVADEE